MESEAERKKRYEEEDRIVHDLLTDAKRQAIQIERDERLKMLRRLCQKDIGKPRPARDEIEKLLAEEKKRTEQINQAVYMALQSEERNKTYYGETILSSQSGEPEYEIISMIAVRKLSDQVTLNKPINLNITMDGEKVSRHAMFIEKGDVVLPGDVHIVPIETEVQIQHNGKPVVSEIIQIKPPDIINRQQVKLTGIRESRKKVILTTRRTILLTRGP